jgi:hypothetical protein
MKKIIASKDFNLNGDIYTIGEPVNVKDIITIRKLNEKGFIEPLNAKQLNEIEKDLTKSIKEENNGYND